MLIFFKSTVEIASTNKISKKTAKDMEMLLTYFVVAADAEEFCTTAL
jgi:hypothetical protein